MQKQIRYEIMGTMEAVSKLPAEPIAEENKPVKRKFGGLGFKIFRKKHDQEKVVMEKEEKKLSLEEAAEEMVDLLEEKNESVMIRLNKRKTVLTIGVMILLLWLTFLGVKLDLF